MSRIIVLRKDRGVVWSKFLLIDYFELWLSCVISWQFWTRLTCLGNFQSIPAKTIATLWIIVLDSSHCDLISVLTISVSSSCVLFYEYELRSCTTITSYCNVTIWIRRCLVEEDYISLFWYSGSSICYTFPLCTDERWASEPAIECRAWECSNRISLF